MSRPAIRIAGCSGSVTDRRDALERLAKDEAVDAIIGDWMSEYNMTSRGGDKFIGKGDAFEPTFLEALEPALKNLATYKKRLVCNAGASDTAKLAEVVKDIIKKDGLDLTVAYVEGDVVTDQMMALMKRDNGKSFGSLTNDFNLENWGHEPIYAQAYLGAFGIVTALNSGADIVLCGRVADASPVIGLAAWWHKWERTDFDALAGAFVAGHIAECSNYVTGGNWSGFKLLAGKWTNLAYPIVEINADGTFITTMEKGLDGIVNRQTISSQLLYEIQGPLYYNSDVVAELSGIELEDVGENRVLLRGVKGRPPPPTTKVGVTALGGYQAELSYYLCGLDCKEKGQMIQDQVSSRLDPKNFTCLKFTITGTAAPNADSQNEATVEFRIFAQAKEEETLSFHKFFRVASDQIMQAYPGATFGVDTRKSAPKPFYEYFVSTIPQSELRHTAQLATGKSVQIACPTITEPFQRNQDSYDPKSPVALDSFGPTKTVPLGLVVHARSGDKGSDANVGFYVRHSDEWAWLQSLLTLDKVKELLGKDYVGKPIFRFEIPGLYAVHFLLKDHLDRGVASTSTYDYLGKNVAEYLRSKYVDVPVAFLERGSI